MARLRYKDAVVSYYYGTEVEFVHFRLADVLVGGLSPEYCGAVRKAGCGEDKRTRGGCPRTWGCACGHTA